MTTAAQAGPATRSLADALPRVELAPRLARQRLAGARYELIHDNEHWAFTSRTQAPPGRWGHALLNDLPCAVLSSNERAQPVGERLWSDYTGDAKLMAWSLAHESLLAALGRLCGGTVTPINIVSSPQRVGETLAGPVLDFSWQPVATDGEAQEPWRGTVALDPTLLNALIERCSVHAAKETNKPLVAVPIPVHVHCDGPQVDASTLLDCAPGDAIVIGAKDRLLQRMCARTTDNAPLPLALDAAEGGVRASLLKGHATMSDTAPTESPAQAQAAGPDGKIAARIPVQLAIQTAAVSVTLAELADVEAGVVLPLEAPVAGTNVTVLANGAAIGEGELVAAGDKLAVCITRWRPDGL